MEILVIWVVFAILTAVVASNKGRSGIGWLLLGLVFGIFALILVALLSNQKTVAARHAELVAATRDRNSGASGSGSDNARRPCPRCGESIALTARVCRFCNQNLDESAT